MPQIILHLYPNPCNPKTEHLTHKDVHASRARWHTPVVPLLGRLRREDRWSQDFEANMGETGDPRLNNNKTPKPCMCTPSASARGLPALMRLECECGLEVPLGRSTPQLTCRPAAIPTEIPADFSVETKRLRLDSYGDARDPEWPETWEGQSQSLCTSPLPDLTTASRASVIKRAC